MKRSEPHPSLDGTLRRLLWSMLLLVCVILVATLAILLLHNQQYSLVTANIVRASQFNQNFKEEVDLKMYYYVIDSSYGETLPLQEVDEAKALAQELLSGTQDRQSRKAITSAIDLCENLHERIVQITETDGYKAKSRYGTNTDKNTCNHFRHSGKHGKIGVAYSLNSISQDTE